MILTLLPLSAFAQATQSGGGSNPIQSNSVSAVLKMGDQNDTVKNLQEILKSDPSVYPEGIVSGYYGKLTTEALKRFQQKYGLPATGVVDDDLRQLIWPDPSRFTLSVLAPNGGETWNRNETQTVSWKGTIAPYPANIYNVMTPKQMPDGTWAQPMMDAMNIGNGTTNAGQSMLMPYFRQVTIDLVRDSDPSFSQRLGTADLFSATTRVSVPSSVPEAKDYRVRVSLGNRVIPPPCDETPAIYPPRPCPLYDTTIGYLRVSSDTSDNVFSILGASTGGGTTDPGTIAKLKEQVSAIEKMIANLTAQIQQIRTILGY